MNLFCASQIDLLAVMLIVSLILPLVLVFVFMIACYKKCPANKIMVIYGKLGKNTDGTHRAFVCIHGGTKLIWPFLQKYEFLDLTPMSVAIETKEIVARLTVGVSTDRELMQSAAKRLLGLETEGIVMLTKNIAETELAAMTRRMKIEEAESARGGIIDELSSNIKAKISEVGLRLININILEIN